MITRRKGLCAGQLLAYHPVLMTCTAGRHEAVGGRRVARARRAVRGSVRLLVLGFGSLLIGHETTYHVHHGWGAEFEHRMGALGHDAYWPALSLLVLSATIMLAFVTLVRLGELWLRSRALSRAEGRTVEAGGGPHPTRPIRSAYRPVPFPRQLARLWALLFPLTALGFSVQENIEHAVAGKGLIWLGALAGHEYELALPVLALVTLLVATLGAAAHWKIATLEERVARALWERLLRPPRRALPPPGWWIVGALCALHWMRTRPGGVRAPPRVLPA